MAYITTISMSETDKHFVKENHISLSRFLREKLNETRLELEKDN